RGGRGGRGVVRGGGACRGVAVAEAGRPCATLYRSAGDGGGVGGVAEGAAGRGRRQADRLGGGGVDRVAVGVLELDGHHPGADPGRQGLRRRGEDEPGGRRGVDGLGLGGGGQAGGGRGEGGGAGRGGPVAEAGPARAGGGRPAEDGGGVRGVSEGAACGGRRQPHPLPARRFSDLAVGVLELDGHHPGADPGRQGLRRRGEDEPGGRRGVDGLGLGGGGQAGGGRGEG